MCRRRCYHCKPSDARFPRLVRGVPLGIFRNAGDHLLLEIMMPPQHPSSVPTGLYNTAWLQYTHLRIYRVYGFRKKKFSPTWYYIIITITIIIVQIIIMIISSSSLFYDVSLSRCAWVVKPQSLREPRYFFPAALYYIIMSQTYRITERNFMKSISPIYIYTL